MNQKLAIGASLGAAALLGALAVAYSNAQSGDRFTAADEAAIREIVRDYLMENPEILIESLNAYAEKERTNAAERATEAARENLQVLLSEETGYISGAAPEKANVAVIELFDYHCGFCKRATDLVRDLTKSDPDVKVVFREFPILREESEIAAKAALASRAQGKYSDFHFALMESSGVLTKERIESIAGDLGVDFNDVLARMDGEDTANAIDETLRVAEEMGVDGTPTFVVASLDGSFVEVITGFRPDDVEAAIKKAKKVKKAAAD